MKRIALALLVGSTLVLASCSLFSVPLTDPFGLDGETVTMTVVAGNVLAPQQEPFSASGSATATVGDSSDARGTVSNTVSISGTATVTAQGAYPDTIVINSITFDFSLTDSETSVSDSATITDALTATRDGPCADGAAGAPCSYTVEVPAGTSVDISVPVGSILNNGAEPNTATATITADLTGTPNALQPGDTFDIELDAGEGSGSL